MRHRLNNVATTLAALACAAIALLWARSYAASETVEWTREWVKHGVSVSCGSVRYHWYERRTHPYTDFYPRGLGHRTGLPTPAAWASPQGPDDHVYWNRFGFRWIVSTSDAAHPLGWHSYFDVPCWALLLVVMPLPLRALSRAWTGSRRRSRRCCVACGYDLRETPDRCPECGANARVTSAASSRIGRGRSGTRRWR